MKNSLSSADLEMGYTPFSLLASGSSDHSNLLSEIGKAGIEPASVSDPAENSGKLYLVNS